jgi:hypothetical protein
MSRSHPPLQQHLLTRSDLARLGVPAGDILAWLARGAIEQVGTLTGDRGDDPVFTAAPELRADLSARLASIGKTAVVLSPMRVRSFLLRALLQRKTADDELPSVGAVTPAEALAEHLATTDLAQVLHEAAAELEADVEHVLRIAEDESRLEASIGVAAGETAAQHNEQAGAAGGDTSADESGRDEAGDGATWREQDDEAGDEEGEDEACFDVDDLASALGEWDDEPTAATSARAALAEAMPTPSPTRRNAPTEDPVGNDVVETVRAPDAAAEQAAATSAAKQDQQGPVSELKMAAAPADEGCEAEVLPADEPVAGESAVEETQAPEPADAASSEAAPAEEPAAAAAIAAIEPSTAVIEAEAPAPMPAMAAAEAASDAVPDAAHAAEDVPEEVPEAAAALAAVPNREEPKMSAEPMATEHEDHPAAEQAASEAIASAEEVLEPLLREEDQPPTFDASEIAAALSVLDLDAGPTKTPKAKAVAYEAPAAAPVSVAASTSTSPALEKSEDAGSEAAVVPPAAPHADAAIAAAVAAPNEEETALEAAPAKTEDAPAVIDEVAAPAAAAPPAAATPPTVDDDAAPLLAASMQRVESFLGELKAALVEMAGRPAASPPPPTIQVPATPPVDLAPLVGAIEGGLQKSAASSAAAATALTGLAEKLDGIGQRIERSAVAAESMAQHAKAPNANAEPARFLVPRSNPVPLTLLAVAAMVTAWSVLFWFKTGSPRLALGTLIGANLVGCVLLTPGRFR